VLPLYDELSLSFDRSLLATRSRRSDRRAVAEKRECESFRVKVLSTVVFDG